MRVREGACPLLQPERGFGGAQPQPLYLFPYLLLTSNAEIDPVIIYGYNELIYGIATNAIVIYFS